MPRGFFLPYERDLQLPSFRCDISRDVQATPTSFRRQLPRGSGSHGRVLPLRRGRRNESDAELLVAVRRLGSLLRHSGEQLSATDGRRSGIGGSLARRGAWGGQYSKLRLLLKVLIELSD